LQFYNRKFEVLSPAGDPERFKAAVDFGADAVYLAGKEFGMRTSPSNFDFEQLKSACEYAHSKNKRVYLTCNTVPRNDEIERLPEFLKNSELSGIDGFIVCDIGVLNMCKKYAPNTEVHISTQAGICNWAAANEFYNLGAKRVVLARELTFDEIAEIRQKIPDDLDIECFVHGSMCVSFSGRCLLSNLMTGRDANRGDCAQPCRWKYSLMEKTREGVYLPVYETDEGTYILNSKDMCMIEHIDKLYKAGINSLKIEGRAKSAYYTAVITNAYRNAVDYYFENSENFVLPDWIRDEVFKVSHREYSTGFYFGNEPGQVYSSGGYIREYEVVAVAEEQDSEWLYLTQRNKFCSGDEIDILIPGERSFICNVGQIYNIEGEPIESAPHAMMKLKIKIDKPVAAGALLRKRV